MSLDKAMFIPVPIPLQNKTTTLTRPTTPHPHLQRKKTEADDAKGNMSTFISHPVKIENHIV